MKTKLINISANILMRLGNFLHKISNNLIDYSFKLHMDNNTKTGQTLKVIQDVVTEYQKQFLMESKPKRDNKTHYAPNANQAYVIKRKPLKDN